jgi:FtsP/CotA-like multicopper oxidase with cupredoxin domain
MNRPSVARLLGEDRSVNIPRRTFLATLAKLGIGATTLSTAGRAFAGANAGNSRPPARTIHLETREVTWELAPGKTIRALTYDGRVPGPEIRAREGERVRVVLKNSLSEATTIHWHSVDVPNAMDGVPGLTQKPVQPGETFLYEFEARPAGTRWYHTHFESVRQLDLGLSAPFIIEPAGPEPFPFDREYTLVLDDWATGTGPAVPDTTAGVAGGRGSMGGMMGRRRGGMMGRMMGGMMGGGRRPAYDTMTINGKAWPTTHPLAVRTGERVRLRLINASAEHTHVVRLAGHRLKVTHTDGNALLEPVVVDGVPIAPAERYDVVFEAARPGAWLLYCAQPGHAGAGEQVLVTYQGYERAKAEAPEPGVAGPRLWQYVLGRGRDVLPRASGREQTFALTLSGGMMGSDVWTINGERYPDGDPLRLPRGDSARINLRNNSMEAHPMHLHGQSFKVLAVDGRRLPHPLVKDTVDVEPHMGTVEIAFTAHNSGDWLFHCHKPMHMEGGMTTLVKVAR